MNGRRCFVANDILYELVRTEAYRARFTVKRDGQKVELPDVQFDTWQDEDGQTHMTLGFTVYGIKKTPLNVLKEAWNSTLYYGRIAFISLADLVRGRESINNLSGPVGIVTAIGQAASYGWRICWSCWPHHHQSGRVQSAALPGTGWRQGGIFDH